VALDIDVEIVKKARESGFNLSKLLKPPKKQAIVHMKSSDYPNE